MASSPSGGGGGHSPHLAGGMVNTLSPGGMGGGHSPYVAGRMQDTFLTCGWYGGHSPHLVAGVEDTLCLHSFPSSSHSLGGRMLSRISSVSDLNVATRVSVPTW